MSAGDVVEGIGRTGLPVVIFGAGVVGEALLCACEAAGLKIACFCDNNVNKARGRIRGVEIVPAAALPERHPDAVLLISAADIGDVVRQATALGYARWYGIGPFLGDFDLVSCRIDAPPDFVAFAVDACLLCQENFEHPDRVFIRSVDLIVTERCSLRCRDCSNLMQYYQHPANCATPDLLASIDELCAYVDGVHEFRLIGGEPFLNKELDVVVRRLVDEPKVRRIVIYTNASILPGPRVIESMRSGKVLLMITDYGPLSRNLTALTELLVRGGIAHYARRAQGWTDCSSIRRHGRTPEEQRQVFRSCCAKNTFTLSEHRLYRCPFSANADRLRAVPEAPGDSVDLSPAATQPLGEAAVKESLRAFVLEKERLEVCDYCNGRAFDAPEIAPAVQAKRPLEYVPARAPGLSDRDPAPER